MEKLGCYYMHIFYPSRIYLDQKPPFTFEFDGRNCSVVVIKTLKSLITNDFDNRITKRTDDGGKVRTELDKKQLQISAGSLVIVMDDGHVGYVIDHSKNLYTEFYTKDYTELVLYFESTKEVDNVSIARRALDHFIDCYRVVSGDVLTLSLSKTTYVSTVVREYFYVYTEEDLKVPAEERNNATRSFHLGVKQATLPFWDTQGKRVRTDPAKAAVELSQFFKNKSKTTPLQEFVLKAREELHVHKNYKYAFIEAWTALEVAIVGYLRNAKLAKGISKSKLDDLESEVGISYLLNIELPLVHQQNDDAFKQLIGKVDAVRKLRNKVIHQNRPISQKEAEDAYKAALEFLDYMKILKVRTLL